MRVVLLTLGRMIRSLKNSYTSSSESERLRFGFILLLGCVILCLVYIGTLKFLKLLDTQVTFGYLPPSVLLSLVLSVVALFSYFISLAHTAGGLSQSEDADLLYSFPLTPTELFLTRAIETLIQTSWMSFVLCFPMLAAMARHYDSPGDFVPFAAILVLILLGSISVLGATSAIILVRVFPPAIINRYLGLIVVLLVGVGSVYLFLRADDLNPIVRIIDLVSTPLLPSSWIGATLGELALGNQVSTGSCWAWGSFAVFALSIGIFSAEVLLSRGCSRAMERPSQQRRSLLLARISSLLPDPYRGIVLRELAFLLRSPATLVHLLFLSGLAVGYGSLISRLDLRQLPVIGNPRVWNMALLGGNLAISGYLATVFLSRLVLPMTSLEGRAVWLSAAAPISPGRVLRIRRLAWCIPTFVITVGTCVLNFSIGSAGSVDFTAEPSIRFGSIALMLVLGWILVSFAIASGAQFARFDWSHPGELIASFGSLVFMTIAVLVTTALALSFSTIGAGRNIRTICAVAVLSAVFFFLAELLLRRAGRALQKY